MYRDIQVVFQNPWQSFAPNMCVGEGIAEGIRYYGRGLASDHKKLKEKVLETMHLVGLSESYYQKKCRELSGGECQRAAIGRAIIRSPRLAYLRRSDKCIGCVDSGTNYAAFIFTEKRDGDGNAFYFP